MDARTGPESVARAGTRSARGKRATRATRHRSGAVPSRDRHTRGANALWIERRRMGAHRGAARGVEGFGGALAEASASGLPVIAGQSGGLAEAVNDGETGFVVNPDDPDAVAAALKRLLGDQLLARRLGQAGRKAIETYYNWDRVIRDLRDIESQVSS